tara:strand:- start:4128 stop:4460 length:333 start_codon:yes stop_codon:yes gene_type:complete
MSAEKINIKKLKKNNRIILETKETVFEIVVISPRRREVEVHGGIQFIRPTTCFIKEEIKKNNRVKFYYNFGGVEETFVTSKVVSATIYGPENSWHYDAIEKSKNENTDKT